MEDKKLYWIVKYENFDQFIIFIKKYYCCNYKQLVDYNYQKDVEIFKHKYNGNQHIILGIVIEDHIVTIGYADYNDNNMKYLDGNGWENMKIFNSRIDKLKRLNNISNENRR